MQDLKCLSLASIKIRLRKLSKKKGLYGLATKTRIGVAGNCLDKGKYFFEDYLFLFLIL